MAKVSYRIGLGGEIIAMWSILRLKNNRKLEGKDWRVVQVMKVGYMIAGVTPPVVTITFTISDIFDVGWMETMRKIHENLHESSFCSRSDAVLH